MTQSKTLLEYKVEVDNMRIEYEVIPIDKSENDLRKQKINTGLNYVNERLDTNQKIIDKMNPEIDRLTNQADGIDYMVAVGSGMLAGLIDSFWVGEMEFGSGKENTWGEKKVNNFVESFAKKHGFKPENYRGDNKLKGAIKHLEDTYHIPSDGIWNNGHYGMNGASHHLDDFAHHPSIFGLCFSILTQFTKKGYFSNKSGEFIEINAPISLQRTRNGKTETIMLIGNDIPSKLFCGVVNWFCHLISDMAGSSDTPGAGMGIPGPIGTLIKEFSALPVVNKTALPQKIHEIFTNNHFDLRSELTLGHDLAKQAVPVILNECIVRAFYFIRRLIIELKSNPDDINWKNCLPFKNRTIVRMLTIATGTMTATDLIDAAIRSFLKNGTSPTFFLDFALRINFVGLGRFTVAVATDFSMGIKRSRLRNERLVVMSEQLQLMNAKVFYYQGNMWIAAETTEKTINEAKEFMMFSLGYWKKSFVEIESNMSKIGEHIKESRNQEFKNQLADTIKWG